MKTINDWSNGFKSLAVILPTVASILLVVMDVALQSQIIPTAYIPVVVFVSGYIGRIIRQPKLNE